MATNSISGTNYVGGVIELVGLSADVDKLPKNVATGSSFYAVDTKELYMFEKSTQTWYKQ